MPKNFLKLKIEDADELGWKYDTKCIQKWNAINKSQNKIIHTQNLQNKITKISQISRILFSPLNQNTHTNITRLIEKIFQKLQDFAKKFSKKLNNWKLFYKMTHTQFIKIGKVGLVENRIFVFCKIQKSQLFGQNFDWITNFCKIMANFCKIKFWCTKLELNGAKNALIVCV